MWADRGTRSAIFGSTDRRQSITAQGVVLPGTGRREAIHLALDSGPREVIRRHPEPDPREVIGHRLEPGPRMVIGHHPESGPMMVVHLNEDSLAASTHRNKVIDNARRGTTTRAPDKHLGPVATADAARAVTTDLPDAPAGFTLKIGVSKERCSGSDYPSGLDTPNDAHLLFDIYR